VSRVIGYVWLEKWNEKGLEGLKPNYDGGRLSELTEEQKEELKRILEKRDDWTTREARELINEEFDVEYSIRHVSRILCYYVIKSCLQVSNILKSFGMKYAKPYQRDYRRPENAKRRV